MYVIIAKKVPAGLSRGRQQEKNMAVVTVQVSPDDQGDGGYETALAEKLNDLVNEGGTGDRYEIVQVLWRDDVPEES